MRRRDLLAAAVGVATLAESQSVPAVPRKGRIKQAAFVQNFRSGTSFEEMCSQAA
jgi:hypothetical protein